MCVGPRSRTPFASVPEARDVVSANAHCTELHLRMELVNNVNCGAIKIVKSRSYAKYARLAGSSSGSGIKTVMGTEFSGSRK